jgi:hypothetical protein
MLRAAVSSLLGGGGGGDRTAQPVASNEMAEDSTEAGASTRDSFDLCGSSDDEAEPVATPTPLSIRVKAEGAKKAIKTEGKRSSPAADDDDDDECQIDDRPHKAARSSSAITPLSSPTGDSDDVMVTGAIDPSMAFAHARCALDPSAPQSSAPWH